MAASAAQHAAETRVPCHCAAKHASATSITSVEVLGFVSWAGSGVAFGRAGGDADCGAVLRSMCSQDEGHQGKSVTFSHRLIPRVGVCSIWNFNKIWYHLLSVQILGDSTPSLVLHGACFCFRGV